MITSRAAKLARMYVHTRKARKTLAIVIAIPLRYALLTQEGCNFILSRDYEHTNGTSSRNDLIVGETIVFHVARNKQQTRNVE